MSEICLTLHNRRYRRHRRDRLTSLHAIFSAAKVPRTYAPRAAQASTRSRPALAHVDSQWCTDSGAEALHPLHAHTRLWRPWVRNPAKERRGADTHGAQYRSPRVIRTGSINPLLTGSPYTKTSLIPPVNRTRSTREADR